jgi:uncharacterized membrane-anchored protein YitT (DUF2179 family)
MSAWQLFRAQWKTAVKIAVVPIVPLLFVFPFAVERAMLFVKSSSIQSISLFTTIVGLLGLLAFFVVSFIAKAALYTAFVKGPRVGARHALVHGTRRFFHVFWTDVLIAILMAVALLPLFLTLGWYTVSQRATIHDPSTLAATDALLLIIALFLTIPACVLAVAFLFSPLLAAVGESPGGIPALQQSFMIVRGQGRPILWRLVGWTLLSVAVSLIVSPLPIARWLVPFLLAIYGTAFLVVVYRELRGR